MCVLGQGAGRPTVILNMLEATKIIKFTDFPGAPLDGHQHSRTRALVSQREQGIVASQVDIQPFLTPCCIPELVHRALSTLLSEREGLSSVQTGTYALEDIPDVHMCCWQARRGSGPPKEQTGALWAALLTPRQDPLCS